MLMINKRILFISNLFFVILLLVLAGCSSEPPEEQFLGALESASTDSVIAHVFELADGRYEGRPTGMPTMIAASEYIRSKMMQYNLQPGAHDTSFFQWWTVDYNQIVEPAVLRAQVRGRTVIFTLGEDFIPASTTGSGSFSNRPLVIIDSSATDRDLAAAAVNAVLFIPATVSPQVDAELSEYELRGVRRRKSMEMAQKIADAGAAALLVRGETSGSIGTNAIEGFPIYKVTPGVLSRLLPQELLGRKQGAVQRTNRIRLSGEINTKHHRDLPTVNVAGVLQGRDRRFKDEYIIVCAHTDHVGTIAGRVHYGAHDNASGTAVMLEVARMFAEFADKGFRPRRSVLFVGFSGEEMGLLGSRLYVTNDPLVPLDKTCAVLNLDILGGGTGYMAMGGENFPEYFNVIESINTKYFGHELLKRPNTPISDQYFFGDAGIPSVFLYALTGPPIDIHTPTDTADKMDPDFMKHTAQFAFAIVWELANRSDIETLAGQ
jgi:hypothetical protein